MRIFVYLALALALAGAVAVATPAAIAKPLEEVVVVGKQPGPKLWRVVHEENELWILGVLTPLPKGMEWDAAAVEAVIADAEQYIQSPGVSVSVNPVRAVLMLPSLWGMQKIPDKKKLVDIVPAPLYARWSVLKAQYLGNDRGVERKRPMLAADELFRRAIDATDLTHHTGVFDAIEKALKKHDVPTVETGVDRRLEKPRKVIKQFKKSTIADIHCFEKTLERIEKDLPVMKTRAAAWALGDIQTMRALPYEDQGQACIDEVLQSAFAEELTAQLDLVDVQMTLRNNWLEAAQTALLNHSVTFATLPISELLKPDGVIAELSQLGYEVRGG